MAVPKKKVSRSRRNMRRFSSAYDLDPVTVTMLDGILVRPHRVTLATLDSYVAAKKARKANKAQTKTV